MIGLIFLGLFGVESFGRSFIELEKRHYAHRSEQDKELAKVGTISTSNVFCYKYYLKVQQSKSLEYCPGSNFNRTSWAPNDPRGSRADFFASDSVPCCCSHLGLFCGSSCFYVARYLSKQWPANPNKILHTSFQSPSLLPKPPSRFAHTHTEQTRLKTADAGRLLWSRAN